MVLAQNEATLQYSLHTAHTLENEYFRKISPTTSDIKPDSSLPDRPGELIVWREYNPPPKRTRSQTGHDSTQHNLLESTINTFDLHLYLFVCVVAVGV